MLKVNISAAKVVINMTEVILLICELYQMPASVYELMGQSISDAPFVTKASPSVLPSSFPNDLFWNLLFHQIIRGQPLGDCPP